MRRNLHNSKADSLETCLRLWLTLLRHFPTLTQQQVYGYDLSPLNLALRQLFQAETNFLLTNDLLLFIEIVEENFLCGLIDLSADQVTSMFASAQQEKEEERQLRLVMATASLYLSYSLLRAPIPGTPSPTQPSSCGSCTSWPPSETAFPRRSTVCGRS